MNQWLAKHKSVAMIIFNVLVWLPVVLILNIADVDIARRYREQLLKNYKEDTEGK